MNDLHSTPDAFADIARMRDAASDLPFVTATTAEKAFGAAVRRLQRKAHENDVAVTRGTYDEAHRLYAIDPASAMTFLAAETETDWYSN